MFLPSPSYPPRATTLDGPVKVIDLSRETTLNGEASPSPTGSSQSEPARLQRTQEGDLCPLERLPRRAPRYGRSRYLIPLYNRNGELIGACPASVIPRAAIDNLPSPALKSIAPAPPPSSVLPKSACEEHSPKWRPERSPYEKFGQKKRTPKPPSDGTDGLPRWAVLALVLLGLALTVLPAALDESVMSNVLPQITTAFQGKGKDTHRAHLTVQQTEWVSSAYTLAATACVPLYGSLVDLFGIRAMLLFVSMLFMASSLLCGLAPGIRSLIAFRALTGAAGGGMIVLTFVALAALTPLPLSTFNQVKDTMDSKGDNGSGNEKVIVGRWQRRGAYFGIVGAVFSLSSFLGPKVGELSVRWISWRWGFLLNIPINIAAITILTAYFYVIGGPPSPRPAGYLAVTLRRVDYLGGLLYLAGAVPLLLALRCGGVSYPWSSPLVMALLVVGFLFSAMFVVWELRLGTRQRVREGNNEKEFQPTDVPPMVDVQRLMVHRATWVSCVVSFLVGWVLFAALAYLPTFLSTIFERTPKEASLCMVPFMLAHSTASLVAGYLPLQRTAPQQGVTTAVYKYSVLVGTILVALAGGLLYTLNPHSTMPRFLAYSTILGVGVGLPIQLVILLAQFDAGDKDMPTVTALTNFSRMFGGAFGVAIEGVIFDSSLRQRLASMSDKVIGTFSNVHTLPSAIKAKTMAVYSASFGVMFLTLMVMITLALLAALLYKPTLLPLDKQVEDGKPMLPSDRVDREVHSGTDAP
ncbi:hypothetical protein IWQ60_001934 [Tieghemiomyces parasiticus]|uniref:Major facilitator superfamily (MFS) profile domain-containing protein n=1 Tax=Tieghemiomyces parasiticus TaxID=78921 RepID=A0A9W8AD75_9FUNG|nr:hypothetical protein IWQ60_001934 [Tieghemiomyces parasiticus]